MRSRIDFGTVVIITMLLVGLVAFLAAQVHVHPGH